MAFNGSGTFTRTNGFFSGSDVWTKDRENNVDVIATRHDTHDEDVATAINNLLTRDGSNSPSADINMKGFRHTGCGNPSARTNFATVDAHQDSELIYGGTSTGASNVYEITLSPAITAYVDGQNFIFLCHQDSTDTQPTLNVNSVGAKSMTKSSSSAAIAASDIKQNKMVWVAYDATNDVFQVLNPST